MDWVPLPVSDMLSKVVNSTSQVLARNKHLPALAINGLVSSVTPGGNGHGLALGIGVYTCMWAQRRMNSTSASSSSGGEAGESSKTRPRKKSMLYTRTGDKGESSLYNGERRPKSDPVFLALGEQDELCAAIGIAREYCELASNDLSPMLIEVQSRLFDLGSAVATPVNNSSAEKLM